MHVQVPQLLPGSMRRSVPLAAPLTSEDERVIANVAIITDFLAGGRSCFCAAAQHAFCDCACFSMQSGYKLAS